MFSILGGIFGKAGAMKFAQEQEKMADYNLKMLMKFPEDRQKLIVTIAASKLERLLESWRTSEINPLGYSGEAKFKKMLQAEWNRVQAEIIHAQNSWSNASEQQVTDTHANQIYAGLIISYVIGNNPFGTMLSPRSVYRETFKKFGFDAF